MPIARDMLHASASQCKPSCHGPCRLLLHRMAASREDPVCLLASTECVRLRCPASISASVLRLLHHTRSPVRQLMRGVMVSPARLTVIQVLIDMMATSSKSRNADIASPSSLH